MGDMPKGLPGESSEDIVAIAMAMITCPDCNQEGRVVSNHLGKNVYCGPCKKRWPITSVARGERMTPTSPRPLSKETLVEPDWSKAFEDLGGDPTNDQVGPKRK